MAFAFAQTESSDKEKVFDPKIFFGDVFVSIQKTKNYPDKLVYAQQIADKCEGAKEEACYVGSNVIFDTTFYYNKKQAKYSLLIDVQNQNAQDISKIIAQAYIATGWHLYNLDELDKKINGYLQDENFPFKDLLGQSVELVKNPPVENSSNISNVVQPSIIPKKTPPEATTASLTEVAQLNPVALKNLLFHSLRLGDITYSGFSIKQFLEDYCGLGETEATAASQKITKMSEGLKPDEIAAIDLAPILDEFGAKPEWLKIKVHTSNELADYSSHISSAQEAFKYAKAIVDCIVSVDGDGNSEIYHSSLETPTVMGLRVQEIFLAAIKATASSPQARKQILDYMSELCSSAVDNQNLNYVRLGAQTCATFALEEYAYILAIASGQSVPVPNPSISVKDQSSAQSWIDQNTATYTGLIELVSQGEQIAKYPDLSKKATGSLNTIIQYGSPQQAAQAAVAISGFEEVSDAWSEQTASMVTSLLLRDDLTDEQAEQAVSSLVRMNFVPDELENNEDGKLLLAKIEGNFNLIWAGFVEATAIPAYIENPGKAFVGDKRDLDASGWFLEKLYAYCDNRIETKDREFRQKNPNLLISDEGGKYSASQYGYAIYLLGNLHKAYCTDPQTRFMVGSQEYGLGVRAQQYLDELQYR